MSANFELCNNDNKVENIINKLNLKKCDKYKFNNNEDKYDNYIKDYIIINIDKIPFIHNQTGTIELIKLLHDDLNNDRTKEKLFEIFITSFIMYDKNKYTYKQIFEIIDK